MLRAVLSLLAVLAFPVLAEEPNLSPLQAEGSGSAARLVTAQETYLDALASGDVPKLLEAIRLARSVTLRPAPGWIRTTEGEVAEGSRIAAPDPAGEAALTIARNLAGEDPDLQDLVWDLDAQLPGLPAVTAVEVRAIVGAGQSDSWRLPLYGEVAGEIGLIGDGPLQLTIQDDGGAEVCAKAESDRPALCRLTPARNGFFVVTVRNAADAAVGYRLIGN